MWGFTPLFTTSLEDSPPLRALPTSRSTQPLSRSSLSACAPSTPSRNTWSNHTQLFRLPQPPPLQLKPPTTSAPLTRPHPPHPLPKPIYNAPHLSYVTSQVQAEESLSPCLPPAAIPLAKPLPPFQGQHKRQAVSNSPPNASPSAHSSPTRCSPTRNTNTNPLPGLGMWAAQCYT